MAIQLAKSVAPEHLAGKFGSLIPVTDRLHASTPIYITKASGARLYYQEARKQWDHDGSKEGRWTWIAPTEADPQSYAKISSLRFVCDTLDEAVALRAAAGRFMQEDMDYEKRRRDDFYAQALSGTLEELKA